MTGCVMLSKRVETGPRSLSATATKVMLAVKDDDAPIIFGVSMASAGSP